MPNTFDDARRTADYVMVPDIVGLPFLKARDVAAKTGLALANPDPDGPSIGSIVWPNNPRIIGQDPEPGAVAHRWDSLRIWLGSDLDPELARTSDDPPPSSDSAHAIQEVPPTQVDLARDRAAEIPGQ